MIYSLLINIYPRNVFLNTYEYKTIIYILSFNLVKKLIEYPMKFVR